MLSTHSASFGSKASNKVSNKYLKQKQKKGWLTVIDGALTTVPPPRALHQTPVAAVLMARDKGFLYQEYVVKGKSAKEIAREQRCTPSTVAKYLLEFGFDPRRSYPPDRRRGMSLTE